jgi:hypothetical protein
MTNGQQGRAGARAVSMRTRVATFTAATIGVLLMLPGVAAAGYSYTSEQPPHTGGVSTLMDYGFWAVGLAGVLGIFGICGVAAVSHQQGRGAGEHLGKFAMVCAAMVGAGAAGSIVTALL